MNASTACTVRLKPGREAAVKRRHPWIFSGAIGDVSGDGSSPVDGGVARVVGSNGGTLGYGLFSPHSQIRVRMWTFGESEPAWPELLRERMAGAKRIRAPLLKETDGLRYINSEGDFLPGVFLDKYAQTLVLQILTSGTGAIVGHIVDAIKSVFDEPNLYERSGGRDDRSVESRQDREGVVYGAAPDDATLIRCGRDEFEVDIRKGHKSGFYLDQRANRRFLQSYFAAGPSGNDRVGGGDRKAIDCFSYSGAFGISLRSFFSGVEFVDSSVPAIERCRRNWSRIASGAPDAKFTRGDAFDFLRSTAERSCDLVILDPPSFAKRAGEVDGACRGHKDIQRLAFRILKNGGHLAAFSCSQHIGRDLFQKVVFSAALDAGRAVQIAGRFGHDIDHPVSLDHPEGEYLHGLFLRVAA